MPQLMRMELGNAGQPAPPFEHLGDRATGHPPAAAGLGPGGDEQRCVVDTRMLATGAQVTGQRERRTGTPKGRSNPAMEG
jgi:hypothetical protein